MEREEAEIWRAIPLPGLYPSPTGRQVYAVQIRSKCVHFHRDMERNFSFTVEQTQTLTKGLPHEVGMGEQCRQVLTYRSIFFTSQKLALSFCNRGCKSQVKS